MKASKITLAASLASLALFFCPPIQGQISYSGGTYSQDFDTLPFDITPEQFLTGTGPFDVPTQSGGTLEGWSIFKSGGTGANTRIQSNDGSAFSGSIYFYGTPDSQERALGALASGTGAYTFGATFLNTSLETYTSFTLAFTGEQWRYGGSGNQSPLAFSFAIDATSIGAGAFTNASVFNVPSLITTGTAGPLDGNLPEYQLDINSTQDGLVWAPGSTLTIRWADVNDAGSDDGLAVDNLSFIASAGAFRELTWTPETGSTAWNSTAPNWEVNSSSTTFANGDLVRFGDTGVGQVEVDAGGVQPIQTEVNNISGTYTFTGGNIEGSGQFIKNGAGRVEISNLLANTGGIVVNGGTLATTTDGRFATGVNVSLGAGSRMELAGAESIGNLSMTDATLAANPLVPVEVTSGITIGEGSVGSVISGALNTAGPLAVSVLNGNSDTDLLISADLGGFGRMTFSGGGTISLTGSNLGFGGGITLSSNTVLVIADNQSLGTNQFFFNGGQLTAESEMTGDNRITNPVSIGGDVIIDATNAIEFSDFRTFFGSATKVQTIIGEVTVSGPIGFNNLINKGGDGTLILSAENTYGGNTTVQGGVLKLVDSGTISNSPIIRVDSGATLDLSELTTEYVIRKTEEVTQRLSGGGVIEAPTAGLRVDGVIAPGGDLAGGGSDTQTLTINGNLTFGLESQIELQLAGNTTDLIDTLSVIGGMITLDGELVLSLLNGFTPIGTDSFLVMQATSITGQFSNVAFGERIEIAEGSFLVTNTGTSVLLGEFVPIPEPSVYVLMASIAGLMILRRFASNRNRTRTA